MLSTAQNVVASIPSPPINSIELGPFTIRFYALFIILGIIIAVIMTNRTLTRRGAEKWVVIDIALVTVPISVIFARFFHVFTHFSFYFAEGREWWNPMQKDAIWNIWDGGIAIYGALIGGAIGAWLGCKWTGIRFWTFADAMAPWMLLAQALGRLGNYFNHELFGLPTALPWGLEIESTNPAFPIGLPEGTLFHPTFLYEIVWNVLGVAALLLLARKFKLQWGRVFALYMIWYGAGRIVWESIRIDPSDLILGIRTNVWSAILGVLVGVIILIVQRGHHGQEPGPYVAGRGPKDGVLSEPTPDEFVDVSAAPAQADELAEATSTSETASDEVAAK